MSRPEEQPRAASSRGPSRRLLVALLAFGAGACSGGGQAPPLAGFNVVVIVVDTLRADHVGSYGYARDTTPFLDALAAEGVVFERALSTSSFTRESVSSLFTGRLPSRSGSFGWFAAPAADSRPLGQRFADAGYRTGFFSATVMLKDPRYVAGFEQVEHLTEDADWTASRNSAALTERALRFLEAGDGRPFMLYLHYLDPHAPYAPPPDLRARLGEPIAEPLALYGRLRGDVPAYVADGFGPGDPRYEDMLQRYDAEILDVDRALAALFAGLEQAGAHEDTLVIVTADHGEEFLEHQFVEHAWTLYDEQLHVPLIVWAGSALTPERVPRTVSLVDVLPSLATLTGLAVPDDGLDGRSLFESEGGRARPRPSAAPRYAEVLIQHRNVARTVIDGDWKLVQAQRWLSPAQRSDTARDEARASEQFAGTRFDAFADVVHEELFNLREDPFETADLLASHPEQAERLRALLAAYSDAARRTGTAPTGPTSAQDMDRLRELGYAGEDR